MKLTLTRPDDWHLHLRDGAALGDTVTQTARRFARAIVMPNLKPPVTTTAAALAYRERILAAAPGADFQPLMTLYLTDHTGAAEIERAAASGAVHAVKLYPAGATTHSDSGVTDVHKAYPALQAMERLGMPLLIHGEVTQPEVDVFDRERVFLDAVLGPLLADFPALRVVLEHITTREATQFIAAARPGVAATITPHHLLLNRNALFAGGLRPHHYCLPVLKREDDRQALIAAATGGNPRFFLGTDSAPHPRGAKEAACGCAGIYSAPLALEIYAQVFEEAGCLDRLEPFAAFHGSDFYGLPRNRGTITLQRTPWTVPPTYPLGGDAVVPLCAGQEVPWRVVEGD